MGQITIPSRQDIILTAVDRLVARNADGGLAAAVQHVILLGENAGQNDSANNIIALGAFALDAGLPNSADTEGSIAIGVNAGTSLTDTTTGGISADLIAIGQEAAQALVGGSGIVIGKQALENAVGSAGVGPNALVIIGFRAVQNQLHAGAGDVSSSSVIIGTQALQGNGLNSFDFTRVVIIGSQACQNITTGQINSAVVIGEGAGIILGTAGASNGLVLLGSGCCNAASSLQDSVCIGSESDLASGTQGSVVIGANSATGTGGNENTVIGSNANSIAGGDRNIFLGAGVGGTGAGGGEPAANSDRLLIETLSGITRRTILYGNMADGNLIVGASVAGVSRDMPGTNILKLINGTNTGTPVGGGFFFGTAGEILWQTTTAGFSVNLTPAGQLASRTAAFTNNAAAAVATLNNSPTAGDPTKWIPINDNGTIRNIPAW